MVVVVEVVVDVGGSCRDIGDDVWWWVVVTVIMVVVVEMVVM